MGKGVDSYWAGPGGPVKFLLTGGKGLEKTVR